MGARSDGHHWTPDEDQWLLDYVRLHGPALAAAAKARDLRYAQITNRAAKLGTAYRSAIADYHAAHPQAAPPPVPLPAPGSPPPDPVETERLRQEQRRAILAEKADLEAVAGERSFRGFLERLTTEAAATWAPVHPVVTRKPIPTDASEETLVLSFSDWHGYERVSDAGTRGFNTYDADVMAQRIFRIVEATRSIKRRMEKGGGWRFPRLVVSLNGDLISGTIHEVEHHSDAPSVVHAVYGCGELLARALADLAQDFAQVEVFCTSGNHGRFPDAKRMQQKSPWRNWDTMIALHARARLAATPHVTWFLPEAYSVAFDVEGWRFLQTHGHDVKSWNAIPWYGINRLVTNINALEAGRGTPVHYWLFGHFHNASSLAQANGEAFINGSLIGGTEYSVNALGRSDRPMQWLLGVHREHGVTHRWPLYADKLPADAPAYPWAPWRDSVA